MKMLY